jgi:acylglycerol lipase
MAQFIHDKASFQGNDGIEIVFSRWIPEKAAGCVIIIHGIGEYSGRYTQLAEALASKRIAVFAPDLRGHGRSGGIRGYVNSFREYLTDIKLLVNIIHGSYENLPLAFFGHSMGGVIAARYTLNFKQDASAIILSSPGFIPLVIVPPFKKFTASLLNHFSPSTQISRGMHPEQLTHDESEAKAYAEDPLVHHVITPRLYSSMNEHALFCLEHSNEIKMPLLIIHGTDDTVCSIAGSESFFNGAQSADKTFIPLPNLAHEVLHEILRERKKAVSLIVSWVVSHFTEAHQKADASPETAPKKTLKIKAAPEKKKATLKKSASKKPEKTAPKKIKAVKKGKRR